MRLTISYSSDPARSARRRRLAALVVAVVATLVPGTPTDPALAVPGDPSELAAAVAHEQERDLILDVIRRHRRSADEAWRQQLADAIHVEARREAVDPLLVASIVAMESSFRSRVVSRAGAVGLMQLRPWVARDVAERFSVEWQGRETLHAPQLNVRLGVLYYKELVERFDGDAHKALAAYNRGPTRVSRELRDGTFRGGRYAENVLGLYRTLSSRRVAAADTSA